MSEQDLALLAEFGAAFQAGGFDAIFPFLHPDFQFDEPPEQPGATTFRGHEECREGFRRWSQTWAEQRTEVRALEPLPDGRFLAFTRETMIGRDGLRVETDSGSVLTLRDGKVLRWQVFWDPANARAAAGL